MRLNYNEGGQNWFMVADITNTPEGEDLNTKSRQLKLHHIQQMADTGEEQECFILPQTMHTDMFSNFIRVSQFYESKDLTKTNCTE